MSGILNGIKLLLTTVRIDDDSGVLVQEGVLASKVKWIRIWNFVEPCAVYGLILLIIWTSMLDMKIWWVRPSLGVILAWLLVVSPVVHYPFEKDVFISECRRHRWGPFWFWFFECRGLGSPFKYYLPLDGERPYIIKYWKTILGVTLFIDLLFVSACITFSEEIAERFAEQLSGGFWQGIWFRAWLILKIDAGLVFIAYPFMLRLDNFAKSLKFMGAFLVFIGLAAVAGNLLFQMNEPSLREVFKNDPYMGLRGAPAAERLARLNVFAIGGQWSGYVFWGFLQQLLFMGIFSVQFCRAFDIGRSRLALSLACLCSATFFGLIHIPNFWLSLVTFLGGLFGSLYSLQCRNLFSLGIVHGFGGTMMNKLLPINFSVGPSQVK